MPVLAWRSQKIQKKFQILHRFFFAQNGGFSHFSEFFFPTLPALCAEGEVIFFIYAQSPRGVLLFEGIYFCRGWLFFTWKAITPKIHNNQYILLFLELVVKFFGTTLKIFWVFEHFHFFLKLKHLYLNTNVYTLLIHIRIHAYTYTYTYTYALYLFYLKTFLESCVTYLGQLPGNSGFFPSFWDSCVFFVSSHPSTYLNVLGTPPTYWNTTEEYQRRMIKENLCAPAMAVLLLYMHTLYTVQYTVLTHWGKKNIHNWILIILTLIQSSIIMQFFERKQWKTWFLTADVGSKVKQLKQVGGASVLDDQGNFPLKLAFFGSPAPSPEPGGGLRHSPPKTQPLPGPRGGVCLL